MSKRRKSELQALKEGREKGLFLPTPILILQSQEFAELSPHAVKLLFDLAGQWHPGRNGYLSATWTLMQPRGWKSKATLAKALKELEDSGFILRTRMGGRHQCSLYAFTFLAIDEHQPGKPLDVRATASPLSYWRKRWNPAQDKIKKPTPSAGARL